MLDFKRLRSDVNNIASKLARRGFELDVEEIRRLEAQRKSVQISVEGLQSMLNAASKEVGKKIVSGDQNSADKIQSQIVSLSQELDIQKTQLTQIKSRLERVALSVPNIPDDFIPDGRDEENNLKIFSWGEARKELFEIKDHVDLGRWHGGLDFEAAAKVAGSRFIVMRGQFAHLNRAIIQFMMDLHTEQHGYEEVHVPYLANKESLQGTGQLPKFGEDLYHTEKSSDKVNERESRYLSLIPTAEVPLTNLLRDQILDSSVLPVKMVAHTPCFRSEAGSYGKDTRGLIRMHQFDKVELVQAVKPEDSADALEELTKHAEKVLQLLDLPYTKMLLCAGELGFSARKTYDLEVWLPAQHKYREVSSCSNIGDFQARRMRARFRRRGKKKPELIHTLNGSGLAVGRTMIAILEHYQLEDGRIRVPKVLQKYMNGLTHIG